MSIPNSLKLSLPMNLELGLILVLGRVRHLTWNLETKDMRVITRLSWNAELGDEEEVTPPLLNSKPRN